MTKVVHSHKSCAMNPLKTSTPLGAALAYLGVAGAVPLFHGAQGCTSFGVVLSVRHYKEAIPLQTTALDEVTTILGGADNLEQALLNVQKRMKPALIGVASTALTETRGEDTVGDLRVILARQPALAETRVVFASTPDYEGALEDGWSRAVSAIIEGVVLPPDHVASLHPQVNVLAGVHQTAADIEALVDTIEAFGLVPVVLPDISGSLDGTVPEQYVATSLGGTSLDDITHMGRAIHTIAIGEHMRKPADLLHARTGVPFTLFASLTGLEPTDRLITLLSQLSGHAAPARIRRQRSQLVDAMLDGHFHFGGKRIAIAGDPDLLYALSMFFAGLGAEIVAAVASTHHSPLLDRIPAERILVGDLADLEDEAKAGDADLLVTHSHGRQAAERLGIPLLRVGFPIFDRLGPAHRATILYRGTRDLIFEVANIVLAGLHAHRPEDFATAVPIIEETAHAGAAPATH